MSEIGIWWLFAACAAGIAGAVAGYRAGKAESDAKYNARWGLEVMAREMTQERHAWQDRYRDRITAAMILVVLMSAPCWADQQGQVQTLEGHDGKPNLALPTVEVQDGTLCLDTANMAYVACPDEPKSDMVIITFPRDGGKPWTHEAWKTGAEGGIPGEQIEWISPGYLYSEPGSTQIWTNTIELEEALALAVKWLEPQQTMWATEERNQDIAKVKDVYQRLKTINEANRKGQ